ncbi:hypothetical protein [Streptomyces luteogriseus]|uniref:hypothetical protein n=1 Tax=Streptomyces luteogriseus TaxID=68233 RepID=UPI0037B4B1B5
MSDGDELLRFVVSHRDQFAEETLKVSVVIDGVRWSGTLTDPGDWFWKLGGHWYPAHLEEEARAVNGPEEQDAYLHLSEVSTSVSDAPVRYVRLPFRDVTAWWLDRW